MKMYAFYRACIYEWTRIPKGRTLFISALPRAFSSSSQNGDTIQPRRAILYVPGHDRRKVEKLKELQLDCAVLDCEDGVAINKKLEARYVIKETAETFDFGKTEFAVRINSIQSGLAEEDLKCIFSSKRIPKTLFVPKVDNIDHAVWINDAIKCNLKSAVDMEPLNLITFVESAKGLLNLENICTKLVELSQKRLFRFQGLVFGSDDFCADIGATRSDSAIELLTSRQLFVLVAKSFKLQAIDMVHINYKDITGLQTSSEESAKMGFTGKQVIHPCQVPIVQKAYSPSDEKVKWAKELIRLFKEHQSKGQGAFTFRGAMIDKPLLLQAEYILKLSEQFGK